MGEEKKEDPTKKLGKEFRDFQKEWRKFITNDFAHLVADVGAINTHVGTLIKQNVKEHAEMKLGMELMQGNIETMSQTADTQLETTRRIVNILEREH